MRLQPIREWSLQFGNRIISVDRANGFIGCVTQGGRAYGKSSYNLKTSAYAYFKTRGYTSDEDAWREALNSVIFTPKELLDIVKHNIAKDEVSLTLILDDAAVHFHSYLFFINVYQTSLLNATFDTIRTVARCLLINCPTKKRLMGGLRNYDDYDIMIYKIAGGGYERKATAIKWYSLPDGHRKYRKEFEDYFSCFLPQWVYDAYMIRRKKYLNDVSVELEYLRDKLERRKVARQEVIDDKENLDETELE